MCEGIVSGGFEGERWVIVVRLSFFLILPYALVKSTNEIECLMCYLIDLVLKCFFQ